MAETGKSVSWSWPSAIKDKLNQNIDQLINRLQQDSRTSKFFDFLFENRTAVYLSTTCFIVGTSLLIVILIIYNPILSPFTAEKHKRRFRLAEKGPELESLITKKPDTEQACSAGAGDTIATQDAHKGSQEPSIKVEGRGVDWASATAKAVLEQPRRGSDPYGGIIELCKQKMPARFADVLELKHPEDLYTFIGRTADGVLYRFQATNMNFIVKIFPVFSESIADKERLLRSLMFLNRLHTSPSRFLCRNFVEIEGAAFVQDNFPSSLLNLAAASHTKTTSANHTGDATTPRDPFYVCRNYLVVSMEPAGMPFSRCLIKNAAQAKSIVQQLCFTLAVGERFAGYTVHVADVDKVYLKSTEKGKIDFRLDGISVAVRLIDGVIAKLGGTSFSLGSASLNENQLIEAADRRIPRTFDRNVEFLSRVVRLLLERIPRDIDPNTIRDEQKIIFDLKDIESHLRNFDCVYRFTMFKFIQPRQSLAVVSVNGPKLAHNFGV
ncbi:uncharacterized protein LOC111259945 isoform X2 [Varroa jacobsoni]|nr:uncharacterized protein LOC111259945 isoform X2 [Varroa jacobsoni]